MSKLKWVEGLSEKDLKNFLDSFDIALFDIDGTLVVDTTLINGSDSFVNKFRELGKLICFVTNNSAYPVALMENSLKPMGAKGEEIISPNETMLSYLEQTGFSKDIYVISNPLTKRMLKEAGYTFIEYRDLQTEPLEANLTGKNGLRQLERKALERCRNVGIVYLDTDVNFQYGDAQVAQLITNHLEGVKLLSGMSDDMTGYDKNRVAIGAQFLIDGMERWTKKPVIEMAKPGKVLADAIMSKFNITDRSRVLMIGDNIFTDVAFGVNSGFKTLLLLSGVTKRDDVENWRQPDKYKPDYIAESLEKIYEIIKHM